MVYGSWRVDRMVLKWYLMGEDSVSRGMLMKTPHTNALGTTNATKSIVR